MVLSDLTIQLIGFRLLAILIISGIHGAILAQAGVFLGDEGPKYDGRLTVFPGRHVEFFGIIAMLLFGLGWGKPIDFDSGKFRNGRLGLFWLILAGFIGLLGLAWLLDLLIKPALQTLPHTPALAVSAFLRVASNLTIWFAILSLLPLPPLTAGLLLKEFGLTLPEQFYLISPIALLVMAGVGFLHQLLTPLHSVITLLLLTG